MALPGSRSDSPSEQSELMRSPPKPRTEAGGELLGQEQSRLVSQCSGYSDWNLLKPPESDGTETKKKKKKKSHIRIAKTQIYDDKRSLI